MSTTTLKARFPDIELSYGGLLHKKVQCNMYQVLPKGKKCILWYTYDDCENICYMLSFGRNGSINQITKISEHYQIICIHKTKCNGFFFSIGVIELRFI